MNRSPWMFLLLISFIRPGCLEAAAPVLATGACDFQFMRFPSTSTQASYEAWQLVNPIAIRLAPSQNIDLALTLTRATERFEGGNRPPMTLDGIVFAHIEANARPLGERIMLHASAMPPGGKLRQSIDALSVSSALTNPALGFLLQQLSTGGEVSVGITTLARSNLDRLVSFGVGYIRRFPYRPSDSAEEYLPASEFRVTSGLTLVPALSRDQWELSMDATVRVFGAEEIDSRDSYREGRQFEGRLTASRLSFSRHTLIEALATAKRPNVDLSPQAAGLPVARSRTGNSASARVENRGIGDGGLHLDARAGLLRVWNADLLGRNGWLSSLNAMVRWQATASTQIGVGPTIHWGRLSGFGSTQGHGVVATLAREFGR